MHIIHLVYKKISIQNLRHFIHKYIHKFLGFYNITLDNLQGYRIYFWHLSAANSFDEIHLEKNIYRRSERVNKRTFLRVKNIFLYYLYKNVMLSAKKERLHMDPEFTIISILQNIDDSRIDRTKLHNLVNILQLYVHQHVD